jgi:hypothetical protein
MHQVETLKLEGKARVMIDRYLALPFGTKPSCPYFNNKRRKIRSGLRVDKGKGTPEEIAEECTIAAKLARVRISELSTDKLKEFLVEQDLGVDCSGFAYHVLNAYSQERNGKSIQSYIKTKREGIAGKLIAKLRPAENIGVATFADERNSVEVKISELRPSDIIVFLGTGKDKLYNHVLLVTGVECGSDTTRISYAHSYSWPSDGVYNHGVREGDILVHGEDLLGGTWKEQGLTGSDNYTFESARNAATVSIRRLKAFIA